MIDKAKETILEIIGIISAVIGVMLAIAGLVVIFSWVVHYTKFLLP